MKLFRYMITNMSFAGSVVAAHVSSLSTGRDQMFQMLRTRIRTYF
jgi:hypothetical protein